MNPESVRYRSQPPGPQVWAHGSRQRSEPPGAARASAMASLAATAPARPPPSNAYSICCGPPPDRSAFSAWTRPKRRSGSSRGWRTCRITVAFYPWMTVRNVLDYLASFRPRWNRQTERELLGQFRLDRSRRRGRCPGARRHSWRSRQRSAPSRSCWCWTSPPRAGPDRAPRVHPDGDRGLPGSRSRQPDGVCLYPPD